jgi:hypothetical protein
MVDLLVVQLGVALQNLIDNRVVFVQGSIKGLFLNEVKAKRFVPVEIADGAEHGLVILIGLGFEAREDEPCCEMGVLLSDLKKHLIDSLGVLAVIMHLNKVTFSIVFPEFLNGGSELDSIVVVVDELLKHVSHVRFEEVQGGNDGHEGVHFDLEQLPDLLLLT